MFQINIVAGGFDYYEYDGTDTVELNVAGENNWSYGYPLSKPIRNLRGVTVLSHFYITGDQNRNRVLI